MESERNFLICGTHPLDAHELASNHGLPVVLERVVSTYSWGIAIIAPLATAASDFRAAAVFDSESDEVGERHEYDAEKHEEECVRNKVWTYHEPYARE